jgi:hypothetical protein
MSGFYPDDWEALTKDELGKCRARVAAFSEKVDVRGVREQMEALIGPLEDVQEAILKLKVTLRE